LRNALLAALLLLAAAAPARALQTNVAGAAAQFLQIGAGARSLGMGEAYTAVADGPDAVYWNPAGLSRMSRPEATYARTELPAGLHHDFLAVGVPSELLAGTFALGVTRLSQDSLALVNASNQTQGSFSPHSEVFSLGYGHAFAANDIASTSRDYFRDNWNIPRADRPYENEREPWTGEIAAGAAIKVIEENLGTRSASAFAVDGGGMFRPTDLHELIVAGAFRHIGSKLTFISQQEALPGELAVSVAYDARTDDWRFLPALEIAAPYAGNVYGKLGFEATKRISEGTTAAMRLGYTSVSTADLGVLSGVTAGVGLQVGKFSFDAAFQPMALLGESFRIGVGWKF
jgi:hypothetical protein